MPSNVPRANTSKKREQLERREQELTHALHSGDSRQRLIQAAENLRAAQLSLLKAELYWAEDGKIQGRDVDDRLAKIRGDVQGWTEKSVDEIFPLL